MKMRSIVLIIIFLSPFLNGENGVSFLPGSSMISKGRDGILIVTLGTGVKATICNSAFTDMHATKACYSMGYSSRGVSILRLKSPLAKNMVMVGMKCRDEDRNISTCSITTDGIDLRQCKEHLRVVHVLCLGKKVKQFVEMRRIQTQCGNNENGYNFKLLRVPGKMNTGFLQIRESNSQDFKFVCNKYLNFGLAQARMFCNLLCQSSVNPRPVMYLNPGSLSVEDGYFKDMICPNEAKSLEQCSHVLASTPCDKGYNIALKCGPEIKLKDPSPVITCANRTMNLQWTKAQTFKLNSSLVSLHPNHTKDCLYTRTESTENVIIQIPLDYCFPIITDRETELEFKYTLERSYASDGLVQFKTKESIEVFCTIPKFDQIAKEYAHGEITYPPIKEQTRLSVTLTLHTGFDFAEPLPIPYDIQFYTTIYAKATITNPLNQIKLSLTNCFITTADSYTGINSLNSAKIIENNCPDEKYNVQIIPLSKWSIGFEFTSFKLAESTKASVNIFCETLKCIVIDDPECGICMARSQRRRRSAQLEIPDIIHAGPILMY